MENEILLTDVQMSEAIKKLAAEIFDKNPDISNIAFVGIQTRGVNLARRLRAEVALLAKTEEEKIPLGILDITLYRDDIDQLGADIPQVKDTDISFDVSGKNIILVDDVLYTGRTIRAALNVISDFGRAKTIQLAVLAERGGRELPIEANYCALRSKTNRQIQVEFKELDGADRVITLK
jgi:pyrimidine operon attenuation protein/uracil phosphoribosyltransferase